MWKKVFGVGALDQRAFANLVLDTGVKVGRFDAPVLDEQNFAIKDGSSMMYLHNVYTEFMQLGRRERLPFLEKWLLRGSSIPDVPDTWDEVRQMLLPTIRDGAYIHFARLQADLMGAESPLPGAAKLVARELAPGLYETVVIDLPTQMVAVTEDRLTKWNVTVEQATEIARDNYRRGVSDDHHPPLVPGVWVISTDDYSTSRLLLPDMLQRLCTDPIVALPNRSTLLVGDPSVPGVFESIVVALEKLDTDGNTHPISSRIYQLDGKTVRAYAAPTDNPASAIYEGLLVQEDMGRYQHEQDLMNQLETEVFYPKIMAVQTPEDRIVRITTWTLGVDSALPPADLISVVDIDEPTMKARKTWVVPWSTMERSGMLRRTESTLPRWRTIQEPTPAWLDANADDGPLASSRKTLN